MGARPPPVGGVSGVPAFFGSDLANEYLLAHTQQGFNRDELRRLAANSIRASFLPETEKERLLSRSAHLT